MGKTDVAVKRWLSDNSRFADLFNGTVFGGKQVILPGELEEMDREADIIVTGKAGGEKGIQRYRDIVKRWRKGAELSVLACESQSKIHYAMPVRNMLYDGLTYTEQVRQIWKMHMEGKKKGEKSSFGQTNLVTEEEYLSKFQKNDRLYPVITLVFYYDQKQWDGAVDLYGMMGLAERTEEQRKLIENFIPNYHINLLDAGNVPYIERFSSDLQQVFGMLKYRGDKKKLQQFMQNNKEYFSNIDVETYQAVRGFLHSEKMLRDMGNRGKEEKIDMCQALEELYRDGVKEGREEGREEGIILMIGHMLENGMEIRDIKKYTGVSDRVIDNARKVVERKS